SLSFSKSVELHDKVIGHYLNIKHYQSVGVITQTRFKAIACLHA
ncbi:IS1 family transposase, partial [Escherichia coli]